MIQKNLNLAPTLEIRPGYRLNVMVLNDIPFKEPYQRRGGIRQDKF
jgi:type IV secretion system protein VirB10